ncbi:MAG: hypothetical protein ABGY96_26800 [bacterium]|nr:hypothetical protein [Gammaproteobacteria bacterium]
MPLSKSSGLTRRSSRRGGNQNSNLDPELQPLRLKPREKQALVAFLRSLSGRIQEGMQGAGDVLHTPYMYWVA